MAEMIEDFGIGLYMNSHRGDKFLLKYFPEMQPVEANKNVRKILERYIVFKITDKDVIEGKGKEYLEYVTINDRNEELKENERYWEIKTNVVIKIRDEMDNDYQDYLDKLRNEAYSHDERKIKFITVQNFTSDSCRMLSAKLGYKDFYCHTRDKIIGKPIQVDQNLKTVTLITTTVRFDKEGTPHHNHFFIGDIIDFRRAGTIEEELTEDFFMYNVIYKKKKYLVLTKEELTEEEHEFTGQIIQVGDFSEISKTLKLKGKTPIFFVYKAKATVETLEQKELVEYIKKSKLSPEEFKDIVFLRTEDNEYEIYRQMPEVEKLVIAQLLSGKINGYGLHVLHIGKTGTGKSFLGEVLANKFDETEGIYEAGSSTLKGLIPSFKSNPIAPGYILKCNRFAVVDELLKMIEQSITQNKEYFSNHLGQMNMLLERKNRAIGSGNDNNVTVRATAKCLFLANPVEDCLTNHMKTLDPSTLARMLIYCQNAEKHHEFIQNNPVIALKNAGIYKDKRYIHQQLYIYKQLREDPHSLLLSNENEKKHIRIVVCVYISYFKTIYDSCQTFVVDYDKEQIKKIFREISNGLTGDLKTLFDSRHFHHIALILDGIVKFRCLFKDFDPTFTPKPEDYKETEELIKFIIKSWDTEFNTVQGIKDFEDDFIMED